MPNLRIYLNKDYIPPDLSTLDEVVYCINCTDQVSGRQGSFIFDEALYKSTGTHFAISEVFLTVDGMFDYMREVGFTDHPRDEMLTVRRAKK